MAKKTPGASRGPKKSSVNRILVGVRLEERLVKVMKGLAELKNASLGELIEEVVITAMDGGSAFADRGGKVPSETRQQISGLKQVYGFHASLDELHGRK
ncbi:MAG: hypothetical protein K1X53_04890 [Candidatus Sumerlaeaceae bacterium]|nr:hypothetical protein [Candidatus Sumerlaeaceae bacterium]